MSLAFRQLGTAGRTFVRVEAAGRQAATLTRTAGGVEFATSMGGSQRPSARIILRRCQDDGLGR
jgi:hypothetical protein